MESLECAPNQYDSVLSSNFPNKGSDVKTGGTLPQTKGQRRPPGERLGVDCPSQASEGSGPAHTLILDSSASRRGEKERPWFRLPSVWRLVTVAEPTQTLTERQAPHGGVGQVATRLRWQEPWPLVCMLCGDQRARGCPVPLLKDCGGSEDASRPAFCADITQPTHRSPGHTPAPCTNCLSKAQTLIYWGEQRNPQILMNKEILQAVRHWKVMNDLPV